MKYRKISIVEAIQYNGNNYEEICNFIGEENVYEPMIKYKPEELIVATSKGSTIISKGDFIIKDIDGVNTCNGQVFKDLYEPITEEYLKNH